MTRQYCAFNIEIKAYTHKTGKSVYQHLKQRKIGVSIAQILQQKKLYKEDNVQDLQRTTPIETGGKYPNFTHLCHNFGESKRMGFISLSIGSGMAVG